MILVWYKGKWYVAQYCQWDGYPKGQGISLVCFLTNTDDGGVRPGLKAHQDYNKTKDVASLVTAEKLGIAPQSVQKDNIAALKAALDREVLYVPTDKEIDEWWDEADKVREEAGRMWESGEFGRMNEVEIGNYMRNRHAMDAKTRPMMLVQPSLARDCGAAILTVVAYAKEKVPIVLELEYVISWDCEWAYVVDLDKGVLEVYKGTESFSAESEESVQSQRFDKEEFVKKERKRPLLLKEYRFEGLEGMTATRLDEEVNAAIAMREGQKRD